MPCNGGTIPRCPPEAKLSTQQPAVRVPPFHRYCTRSASMGSAFIARRAGTYIAATATTASTPIVDEYATGSSGVTPYIIDENTRVDPAAIVPPTIPPA